MGLDSSQLQAMVDGMSAQLQKGRAETQMTLGALITALEAMPPGATVDYLTEPHSYRGYYSDLAFETIDGTRRPAADLLADCRAAMGQVFEGYKGGDFVMGALTPLWLAEYGCCGLRILALNSDGTVEAAPEDG